MRRTSPWLAFVLLIGSIAALLLLGSRDQSIEPPHDPITDDIRLLATPKGKVEYWGCINPGGPIFRCSPPMERLIAHGIIAQPQLIAALHDPDRRNEATLILAKVGDKDAVPHLIDLLPPTADLLKHEDFSRLCVLHALWRLTDINIGIDYKFIPRDPPDVRTEWQKWYAENRDYLYAPESGLDPRGRRVAVDLEAKLAHTPTEEFRRSRPWVRWAEIRTWRDDPAYEQQLREYCFSVLFDSWDGRCGQIYALGAVPGPRALAALHDMCGLATDSDAGDDLIYVLGHRGDVASLPVIEKVPRSRKTNGERSHGEERRAWELRRLRLGTKYAKELKGKPFDIDQQITYLRCLDGSEEVTELVAELNNRKHDCFFSSYAEVAGYVNRPPVRECLKQITADSPRDERMKTQAHAALARLGEAKSLDHLKASLKHNDPGVRLAAAEGLWRLGHRNGVPVLVELLGVLPLETGEEGVEVREDGFKVTALRGTNVEVVRRACDLLGEIGDGSAIEPLRRLLKANLNGVSATGGSGTGWGGRPEAVALARLGDFSGIPTLRAAIANGDHLDIAGSRWRGGDFVDIGRKRFAAELLPLLTHHDREKRACTARDILILLDRGK